MGTSDHRFKANSLILRVKILFRVDRKGDLAIRLCRNSDYGIKREEEDGLLKQVPTPFFLW